MKKISLWCISLSLVLVGAFAAGVQADSGTTTFTNLPEGATVSQLTTLTGTIEFPDFVKYEIFLKSGHNLVWVGNAHSPVKNGNLVRLDPRVFVSGSYQVIVRQVHRDSNYIDVAGPNITLKNPNNAPLPYYPEVEPSFLYPANGLALLRVRNCAGEDFFMDYHSPNFSGDAGDILLAGKSGETICTFSDVALRPAQYGGTGKGGAQAKGAPIEFLAEAGKIYEIVYEGGTSDSGSRVSFRSMPGDDPAAKSGTVPAKPTRPKSGLPTTGQSTTPAQPPANPPVQSILPTTGDTELNPVLLVGALILIAGLAVSGVWAMRKAGR